MRVLAAPLAAALLATAPQAQPTNAAAERVRADVEFLAGDLLEGRDTGSRGHEIAARYVAAEFQKLGLKPAGEGNGWLMQVPLDMSFADAIEDAEDVPDAYERLIMDVIRGNQTLFMRGDEVEAAWAWTDPIIQSWEARGDRPQTYDPGSSGPEDALMLMHRDGRRWREIVLANRPGALAASLRGAGQGAMEPLFERLPQIRQPTLVMAGALDERGLGRAREIAGRLPHARLEIVPDAGHAPHLEAPVTFRRVVVEFLMPAVEVAP